MTREEAKHPKMTKGNHLISQSTIEEVTSHILQTF
jgi:hypothetical protein